MRPEIVTFDCYGTLIDWNRGITRAFRREGERLGTSATDEEILNAYHGAEAAVEAEQYRTYREVLTLLEAVVAERLGWQLADERRGFLAESLPEWPPFPDTNPALGRLAGAGYRVGILSNTDDDLLAGTRQHFDVDFSLLVTAQLVKSYKPAATHFERALEAVGGRPEGLLHVAQSHFHDVQPAVDLGIRVVWVNRLGEELPEGGRSPTAQVGDLAEAVAWIEGNF